MYESAAASMIDHPHVAGVPFTKLQSHSMASGVQGGDAKRIILIRSGVVGCEELTRAPLLTKARNTVRKSAQHTFTAVEGQAGRQVGYINLLVHLMFPSCSNLPSASEYSS